MDIVPSYLLKMDRAQDHLDVITREIAAWAESHPYSVTKLQEGRKEVWRLAFTSELPSLVSLVGADFVHNVRSGLDHLAAALVPASRRDSTSFPIFWQGVWEAPVEGEDQSTRDVRARWNSIVKKMRPEAVDVLKSLQPHAGYTPQSGQTHLLNSLNRLWNTDKHTRFPVVAQALGDATFVCTMADGSTTSFHDREPGGLGDNAKLTFPNGTIDVQVKGSVVVAIRVALPDGYIPIPHHFQGILEFARTNVVERLAPFVHIPQRS